MIGLATSMVTGEQPVVLVCAASIQYTVSLSSQYHWLFLATTDTFGLALSF